MEKCRITGWMLILAIITIIGNGCEGDPLEKLAREQAKEYRYGENKHVDLMIQVEAHAEGWKFIAEKGVGNLLETHNKDVPFIMTVYTHFMNPKDGTTRSLIKTYLYDSINNDWVPIVESVWENKTENEKTQAIRIALSRLWQGDYDYIPLFKTNKEWLDEFRRLKEQVETK